MCYPCNRMTGFQDTWPKLEKWFSGKQNVLVKVNAQEDEETVFKKVEQILQDTMVATEKGQFTLQCSLLLHNLLSLYQLEVRGDLS